MDEVRRRCRMLDLLSTIILTVLVLALVIEAFAILRGDRSAAGLSFMLAFRLPMIFYLWAIWTMRQAFAGLARGALFDQLLPTLLSRVGAALGLGAISSVFVSPWLLRIAGGPRAGAFAAFDPAAITIGLVGLLLVVLSRLFARAVAIRRELDEFF